MAADLDPLDLASALARARDTKTLAAALDRAAEALGATACSLLYFEHNSHGAPAYELARMPAGLRDTYADADAAKVDPVMQHLRVRTAPIAWSRDTFAQVDQVQKWERYADHGLASGVDIALHVSPGRHFVLGLGWSGQVVDQQALRQRLAHVQTLAVFAEPTAYMIATVERTAKQTEALTPRELECLRWASRGLTDELTASVLGLSRRTVAQHVAEAQRKLNSSNRVQAVAIAAASGLLEPPFGS